MDLDDPAAGYLEGTTNAVDGWVAGAAGSSGVALGTGGGRLGTQTVSGAGMTNPFVTLWAWLNKPFAQPTAPASVFLLVGIVAIAILAWNLILYHVRIAAESL